MLKCFGLALTICAAWGSASAQSRRVNTATIRVVPASPRGFDLIAVQNWKERSAPRCIDAAKLGGLMISKKDSIDFVQRSGKIMRAKLSKGCGSDDFYSGLYVKPTPDGMLCEGRDTVYSRSGGSCDIEKFKTMERPK
jgi:hypothetical protein